MRGLRLRLLHPALPSGAALFGGKPAVPALPVPSAVEGSVAEGSAVEGRSRTTCGEPAAAGRTTL